jgi:hypothetical protein
MTALARWVSILGHPFVMIALLVAVPAARSSSPEAARSTAFIAVAAVLPVAVLMVRQVRRGRWTNVDASNVSERPVLFVVALAGLAAGLGWVLVHDPRSFLVRGLLVVAAFLLVAALLTRWVKLSLHLAFVALTATTLSVAGSRIGLALIPLVPVMFWSRLALGRHRVAELVVGLGLGVATGVALALV